MKELAQHYTDGQSGISYNLVDDYYLPCLTLPREEHCGIGRFGLMRRHYLKNHRRVLFSNLLTSGKLHEYLREIDRAAHERLELISRQMAKTESVTEQLKAENQLLQPISIYGQRLRRKPAFRPTRENADCRYRNICTNWPTVMSPKLCRL